MGHTAGRNVKKVRLVLYRAAGKFLFFRIKERCRECDITYVVLQNIVSEHLKGVPVVLKVVNWLNNWWRILWRGGVHAPVLTLNGRIYSQSGRVPDGVYTSGISVPPVHASMIVQAATLDPDRETSPAVPGGGSGPTVAVQSYVMCQAEPNSGRGLGAGEFSWTAALIIDLIADRLRSYRDAT
jgi:hypothetical protein